MRGAGRPDAVTGRLALARGDSRFSRTPFFAEPRYMFCSTSSAIMRSKALIRGISFIELAGEAFRPRTRKLFSCPPQYLAVTGYFPTGYFPTGYLPGNLPIGALPTAATGGGSLRGKSAADATPTKANVATTASTSLVMIKLPCP